MHHVNELPWRRGLVLMAVAACWVAPALPAHAESSSHCDQPIYLTIDTGHMGVASLIAEVLERQHVKATFFLANERTQAIGGHPEGMTLDDNWAAWWKKLASQGHDFGSHTWDHIVWKADHNGGFTVKATSGDHKGQTLQMSAPQYCAELAHPAVRFEQMTGQHMRALFRAPGGKTSPALLAATQACGWQHVPWSDAGFLGDELPSETYPNQRLLDQALKRIKAGDILMMHLGIWSRHEPWAPAVLEPLIVGLKAKGLCFATLRDHPQYAQAGQAPH